MTIPLSSAMRRPSPLALGESADHGMPAMWAAMARGAVTVRDLVRSCQREIRDTPDLLPDRAAALLMTLTALMGNCADEIRAADAAYATVLLRNLDAEEKVNRARIKAETSTEYQRKREARDTKELVLELIRSLKYFLRAKEEEMRLAGHQ